MIEIKNLSFAYKKTKVFEDFNLTISRKFWGQPIMMRRLALSPMKLEKVISW